jgi:hypothetical protein
MGGHGGTEAFFSKRKPTEASHGHLYNLVTGPRRTQEETLREMHLYSYPPWTVRRRGKITKANPRRRAKRNPYLVTSYRYPTAIPENRLFMTRSGAESYVDWQSRVAGYPRPPVYAISDREYKWRKAGEKRLAKKRLAKNPRRRARRNPLNSHERSLIRQHTEFDLKNARESRAKGRYYGAAYFQGSADRAEGIVKRFGYDTNPRRRARRNPRYWDEKAGEYRTGKTEFMTTVRGRNIYFPTKEVARRAVNDYFRRTGILVGVVEVRARRRRQSKRKNPYFVAKKRGRSYVWRSRKAPRKIKRSYRVGGHKFARVCKYKTRRSAMRKAKGTVWTRARRNPYRVYDWRKKRFVGKKHRSYKKASASATRRSRRAYVPYSQRFLLPYTAVKVARNVRRRKALRRRYRGNPGGSRSLPLRPGGKIAVGKYEAWLENYGSPKDKREYAKIMKKSIDLHLGEKPKYVGYEVMNVGGKKITGRTYMASMGRIPKTYYITPKHSGKKGQAFVHDWEGRMPHLLVDSSGKTLTTILTGKKQSARKGWLRGN